MVWFRRRPTYTKLNPPKKRTSGAGAPPGLMVKCPDCEKIHYRKALEENLMVCTECNYHFRLGVQERLEITADEGTFKEYDTGVHTVNALGFVDSKSYEDRLQEHGEKSGLREAIVTGSALIEGRRVELGIMDFNFIGGSMGSVVGEKVARLIERGIESGDPVIIFCASGGARMQEGILSLMQMAKTSCALARLGQSGVPFVAVLTDPTTAGVLASFASLGDVIIAEPRAFIGFAGPRVIKQTIRQELPKTFNRSEFMLEHGFVDMVVPRKELRARLVDVVGFFNPYGSEAVGEEEAETVSEAAGENAEHEQEGGKRPAARAKNRRRVSSGERVPAPASEDRPAD